MPGLIDAHTHILFATVPQAVVLSSDVGFLNGAAVKAANDTRLRGFTRIRDLGGPVFGLKRGIDAGWVPGPRIWPSGTLSSQTGGHGVADLLRIDGHPPEAIQPLGDPTKKSVVSMQDGKIC